MHRQSDRTSSVNDMTAMQSKYIPGWVSSPPAGHLDFLLQQISPSTSERRLKQKAILFGRVEKVCDVVVNHVSASRVHAVVAFDDAGTLQLADLGSTHGTFLDGDRLGKKERRQLQFNENVISFGLSPLKFKFIGSHLSAQAAALPVPSTVVASETGTPQPEKFLGNGHASPAHQASPSQDNPSADQQQQQQSGTKPVSQHSIAATPAEGHIVGEELDMRASTAAAPLQHTHAGTVPLTAADQLTAHTHKPVSALSTTGVMGEEQEPKASMPASLPGTATKAVQKREQLSGIELPKLESTPHASAQLGAEATSQGSRSPDSQAGQDAMEAAQEARGTRRSHSPSGHERSNANKGLHRHSREGAAEAVDVEDGEMAGGPCEADAKSVQKAADAVVGEELHPKASVAVTDASRTSSRPPSMGEDLDLKAAASGFASRGKPEQHRNSSSHKRAAAAPVGEELDEAANAEHSPRHPKRRRGFDPAHISAPTSSGCPDGKPHRPEGSLHSQPHVPEPSKTSSGDPDAMLSVADQDARLQQSPIEHALLSQGMNRSPTHSQDTHQHQHQQQQQQQQQPSASDSGSGHSSGSHSESHPASALPLPSWRQQEQLEPEEEGVRAAVRPRSQSRPFSRSGSQTHNSGQAGDADVVAGFRLHHRSCVSPQAYATNGRGLQDGSLGRTGAGALPSTDETPDYRQGHRIDNRADRRARQPRPSAPSRGPDRAERPQHSPGPEQARRAGGYRPYNTHIHTDRQRPQQPQETRDFRDRRSGRREADMGSDPRQSGPQPPQHPRRPFTRDGNSARPHADSAGHFQNRSMDRGAEHLPHLRETFRHMGPPDARDADLSSHGPAAGRDPHGNQLASDRPVRDYSRGHHTGGHMHPDADRAQHGRSASHGRYADRAPGSRAQTDRMGADSANRRVNSRTEIDPPSARFDARGDQPSEARPRHRQPDSRSDVAPQRRHKSNQHSSPGSSRDPPFRDAGRSSGARSSRDHRDSGARRQRSSSRSTDRGSKKRRKESGFGGEAAAPSSVAGDPTSAAAAVMRMQGHPTGTGLTLEQKKSKLWGSKAAPADVAQADSSYGSNRWDTAAFASATDKEKFSRLMGVKKAGVPAEGVPDAEDREMFSKERQEQVLGDLESQFISGLRRKDGRTIGLGL